MTRTDVLHLIVIDDSANDAEAVSNMLRNGGYAVRAVRVEDDEDLRRALGEERWDLILSKPAVPYFSALDALMVVNRLKLDIPLILLSDGASPTSVEEAINAGARDAIGIGEGVRLLNAILRETQSVRERRAHRACLERPGETEERIQTLVESSRDAIAYIHEGMHIYANPAYLQLFGYGEFAEIEGLPVMDLVVDREQERFKSFLRNYRSGKDSPANTIDVHSFRADGTEFEFTLELAPTRYEGERCIQLLIRDETAQKELEKRLGDLARHDLLTGLYNRQFLLEYLKRLFAKGEHSGALLSIEPDNLAALRQEIGIAASDGLLTDIAKVTRSALGGDSLIARFDDHSFIAVLTDYDAPRAEEAARQLREAVFEHRAEAGGQAVALTCSIGIALFDKGMRDELPVLDRSDKARRTASANGGNRVHLYNPAAEEMAEQEQLNLWAGRVKEALRENRFRLLYQPIVSLRGDPKENYEVLLRLTDETGKEIPPDAFLEAAERSGLMVAIDRWVLAHAAKRLALRHQEGRETNFFIKLSAGSLKDPKFLPWLRDLVQGRSLQAGALTLEVAESIAQSNLKLLKMMAEGLQQLHIPLALDHFNLAPNWPNLLRHCNAGFLKIDGELINGIARDPAKQQQLRGLAAQAKENGKRTIAQYVEDAQTLSALWSCDVDYIQGYFLQGPQPDLNYDFTSALG